MTKISNLSTENLQSIAEKVGGKLWIKGEKIRIYVQGGNNYQYRGKWSIDIAGDGSWESKVFLEEGFRNKNREEYCRKYLREMDQDMENALTDNTELEEIQPAKEIAPEPLPEISINTGDSPSTYPGNFYNGCGSYLIGLLKGKIIASYNFSCQMEKAFPKGEDIFRNAVEKLGFDTKLIIIIPVDGSGTTFFARSEGTANVFGIKNKIYFVPKAGGGRHKNIELIFE